MIDQALTEDHVSDCGRALIIPPLEGFNRRTDEALRDMG